MVGPYLPVCGKIHYGCEKQPWFSAHVGRIFPEPGASPRLVFVNKGKVRVTSSLIR